MWGELKCHAEPWRCPDSASQAWATQTGAAWPCQPPWTEKGQRGLRSCVPHPSGMPCCHPAPRAQHEAAVQHCCELSLTIFQPIHGDVACLPRNKAARFPL